jgi:prevent-host-death family protein
MYTSIMSKSPPKGAPERVEVGIKALRDHLSGYLEQVAQGTRVVITDRGTPVAQITAVDAIPPGLQSLIDRGLVTPAARPASDARTWKRVRVEGGISDLLDEQRR